MRLGKLRPRSPCKIQLVLQPLGHHLPLLTGTPVHSQDAELRTGQQMLFQKSKVCHHTSPRGWRFSCRKILPMGKHSTQCTEKMPKHLHKVNTRGASKAPPCFPPQVCTGRQTSKPASSNPCSVVKRQKQKCGSCLVLFSEFQQ